MSQKQLIKNIKEKMNEAKLFRDNIRRCIPSKREQDVLKNPARYADLFDAEYRWHANTLVMVLAMDKKTPTAELIKRRVQIARQILEITEELVEVGDISEQEYLKDCKYYNDDLKDLI